MPGLDTLFLFAAASLVVAITPGPSNLYVLARTLAHGRRAGILSAGGLALGALAHALAAALGLSALFAWSPTAFALLQYAGAAYLVWLGIHTVTRHRGPTGPSVPPPAARANGRRILWQAALTEILNPKVAVFFVAFLPQFVDPAAGPAAPQLLLLGALYAAVALPCDAAVALAGGSLARVLARTASVQRLLEWLCGTVLVGLGVRLALADLE